MTIIVLLFFSICLTGMRIAKPGELFPDYMDKDNTTCIQGIFVFLVFFRHFMGYTSLTGNYDGFATVFNSGMEQLLVVMFLFYSGYGTMKSIQNRGKSYIKSIPVKILKILLHFSIAVALYVLLRVVYGEPLSLGKVLLSFIGWESIGNSNWYIVAILSLYLFTFISFRLFKRNNLFALIALTTLSLLFLYITRCYKYTYWFNTIFSYLWGMLYCNTEHLIPFKNSAEKQKKIIGYISSLAVAGGLFFFVTSVRNSNEALYQIWNCLFAYIVILITMKFRFNNAILRFLGNHVFGIYILQRIPMIIFAKTGFMEEHPYQVFIVSFLIVLLLAYSFDWVMKILDSKIFRLKQDSGIKTVETTKYSNHKTSNKEFVSFIISLTVVVILSSVCPFFKKTC